jgi:hypothetical protein
VATRTSPNPDARILHFFTCAFRLSLRIILERIDRGRLLEQRVGIVLSSRWEVLGRRPSRSGRSIGKGPARDCASERE